MVASHVSSAEACQTNSPISEAMALEGVLGGYSVGELDSEPLAAWSGFAVFVEFRVVAVRTCR